MLTVAFNCSCSVLWKQIGATLATRWGRACFSSLHVKLSEAKRPKSQDIAVGMLPVLQLRQYTVGLTFLDSEADLMYPFRKITLLKSDTSHNLRAGHRYIATNVSEPDIVSVTAVRCYLLRTA
jgi:hypothetical protein